MTNKTDPKARLMAETFHDDWSSGPAAEFPRRAAVHARRRRAARRALLVTTTTASVVVAFAFFFARTKPASPLPTIAVALATAPISTSVAQKSPAYEIISDTEFETLMRDRAMLILPQENGARKIVVLSR